MSEEEMFTAILLAIGPWDYKTEQATYLVEMNRRLLGREPETQENLNFVTRYILFCRDSIDP